MGKYFGECRSVFDLRMTDVHGFYYSTFSEGDTFLSSMLALILCFFNISFKSMMIIVYLVPSDFEFLS